MKITIAKDELIRGLQAVQNIVSSRTTLPILNNVLLDAEANRLSLTATDFDVTISCSVEAEVEEPGKITLPAKRFFGIVRELTTPEISLERTNKNECTIQAGASFFKIKGLPAEEFPPSPQFAEEKSITLPQEKIKQMLRRVAYAASSEESRYVLNGIYVSLKEHKMTMVATDGRRLALADEEVELPEESQGDFIIPTKAINELNRLLGDKGNVEVRFSRNQAEFRIHGDGDESVSMISKLVEGNYPNYRQVIPARSEERVTLVKDEFNQALRRAELMTSDKANSVKFNFSENNLTITANSPDVGEARESIAINYQGKEMSIAFNPSYMMDPLKILDDDEVFLEVTDELSPGVLKINGPFLYVIMPMRMS